MAGGLLLIIGHFISMFAVADLYQVNLVSHSESASAEEKGFQPSPLSDLATTPAQLCGVWIAATALVVVSLIMVGSQPMAGAAALVIYFMCPLACGAGLVGWPLRQVKQIAIPAATVYLGLGVCLTGVGAFWLVELWGEQPGDGNALLAAWSFQAGFALAAGALIKFWRTPDEDEQPILADLVDARGTVEQPILADLA
jgi:hypothetical protein